MMPRHDGVFTRKRRRRDDGERDAERSAREMREREGTWGRARGPSITRVVPQPPRPRGPERGGGGFER